MLCVNGIKDVTTRIKNPQPNAMCEQPHQSISKTLWTMLHAYPPNNIDQTNDIMDTCFVTAANASSKVVIHSTLNMSPGTLVFQRDMILNKPLITDLLHLHEQWQNIIDEQLQCTNLCHKTFDYKPGDQILILTNNPTTIQEDCSISLFSIIQVHT